MEVGEGDALVPLNPTCLGKGQGSRVSFSLDELSPAAAFLQYSFAWRVHVSSLLGGVHCWGQIQRSDGAAA